MDALIFDFDGVIVDSEPTHMACFQQVLADIGVELTRKDYYGKYLGFDDHDCFTAVLNDRGRPIRPEEIDRLTNRKTTLVQQAFAESIQPLPGAVELLRSAKQAGIATAICSGALREEIEQAARTVGAMEHVMLIVAARDVRRGKPDPEGYVLALSQLGERLNRPLRTRRTVVVEDTPAGIAAGKAAGMKVLAVTTSYPSRELAQADRIVASLADVTLSDVEAMID